jgi:hypothetical protein
LFPHPEYPAEEAFRPSPQAKEAMAVPNAAWARGFRRALDCEKAALRFADTSADLAWTTVTSCVGRGDFTALPELATDFAQALRSR